MLEINFYNAHKSRLYDDNDDDQQQGEQKNQRSDKLQVKKLKAHANKIYVA